MFGTNHKLYGKLAMGSAVVSTKVIFILNMIESLYWWVGTHNFDNSGTHGPLSVTSIKYRNLLINDVEHDKYIVSIINYTVGKMIYVSKCYSGFFSKVTRHAYESINGINKNV